MCPNRNLFSTYGIVGTLDVARHASNLKRNFISLSTLDMKMYKYIVESRVLKVSKGAHIVMNGQRISQLYVLLDSIDL